MAQAIPYLSFDGTCADAMRFYERILGHGAKIELMLSGADTPMAAQIPKEHARRIIHARLRFDDGGCLYAGDAPAHMPFGGMKGVMVQRSLTIMADEAFYPPKVSGP